jgi:hypothetical protein
MRNARLTVAWLLMLVCPDSESTAGGGAEKNDLTELTPRTTGPEMHAADFALGARRLVSDHSDLGARVDFDEFDGHGLIGVRLIDYRYRFTGPLAMSASLGAARYDLATPAFGFLLHRRTGMA